MIKLTNKKEIKGDLLFLGGGSGPQPGGNVAWLTPTMLALFGIENGKPYNIGDSGYVEFYFLCREGHLPTINIKMDGVDATDMGSDVVIPITEEIIQMLIEEGFPEDIINEFRAYVGYFIMLGYGLVPPLTTGTHSITLKVDNLVYTDIIEYSNTFYYVSRVTGNTIRQNNTPAKSAGVYYNYIQRITVVDPPKLGVLAPNGNYYFMVMSNGNEYYVKVPQPLDVDDEISVDGVTINGYFNPDYKLPHIPTSVANYTHSIDIYNAYPTSQDWGETVCQWDNAYELDGYYQLDGVGNMNKDDIVRLPDWTYDNHLTNFDIEIELSEDITDQQPYWRLLGHHSVGNQFRVYLTPGSPGYIRLVMNSGIISLPLTTAEQRKGAVLHIKLNRNIFSCNDRTISVNRAPSSIFNGIGLFQYYNDNHPDYGTKIKVHYVKWYNNGNLEHNLVPGIYAQLHTIDTDYGHSAFYDTVSGEWIGTDLFLTQGNIAQPVCLLYSAGSSTKIITGLIDKLASGIFRNYAGNRFSSAASTYTYSYPNSASVRSIIKYIGSWDEIITHSTLQDDGTILYEPDEPLSKLAVTYPESGMSIDGLNHPTGSSVEDVLNQVRTNVYDYPTGCTFIENGVTKILIGKLNTPNKTLQGYREYIRDNYATEGIAITYGRHNIPTNNVDTHNPLWRTTEGDEVSWSYDPAPSTTQITEIEL